MRILDEHNETSEMSGGGGGKWGAILVVILLIAVAGGYWYLQSREEAPREPSPAPAPTPEPEAPEPPTEPAEPGPRATTGSLSIRSSQPGARVLIDGEVLGEAPRSLDDLAPGRYRVRVEKEGFQPYEREVQIRAGRASEIVADLQQMLASLRVESDIPGASVFLDREYLGTTPVEVNDVPPGDHQLTVSAEGHEMYAEDLILERGRKDVMVRFQQATVDQSVQVVHKHTFGSCEGQLIADTQGLRYVTDNKNDGFSIPFSALEEFEIDYLDKNLRVKIRNGKRYNFTEMSGDADALFVFHREVTEFIQKASD